MDIDATYTKMMNRLDKYGAAVTALTHIDLDDSVQVKSYLNAYPEYGELALKEFMQMKRNQELIESGAVPKSGLFDKIAMDFGGEPSVDFSAFISDESYEQNQKRDLCMVISDQISCLMDQAGTLDLYLSSISGLTTTACVNVLQNYLLELATELKKKDYLVELPFDVKTNPEKFKAEFEQVYSSISASFGTIDGQ